MTRVHTHMTNACHRMPVCNGTLKGRVLCRARNVGSDGNFQVPNRRPLYLPLVRGDWSRLSRTMILGGDACPGS